MLGNEQHSRNRGADLSVYSSITLSRQQLAKQGFKPFLSRLEAAFLLLKQSAGNCSSLDARQLFGQQRI